MSALKLGPSEVAFWQRCYAAYIGRSSGYHCQPSEACVLADQAVLYLRERFPPAEPRPDEGRL